MFSKWLMTGSAALLAFLGAAMLDCTYTFLAFVDAFDFCVEADVSLPGGSVAFGVVLLIGGLSLIAYTWVPFLIDLYREKEGLEETQEALVKNVHRLPEEASGPVEKLLQGEDEQTVSDVEIDAEDVSVHVHQSPDDTEPELAPMPEDAATSLLRRVELMETLLRDGEVAPGPVARHWIELLREANRLHRGGTIDKATFTEANTRLLDLYVSPDDDPYDARRKVGSELVS